MAKEKKPKQEIRDVNSDLNKKERRWKNPRYNRKLDDLDTYMNSLSDNWNTEHGQEIIAQIKQKLDSLEQSRENISKRLSTLTSVEVKYEYYTENEYIS